VITVGLLVPVAVVVRRSGRRAQLLVGALADFVDTLGRSLRSGASFATALTEATASQPPVLRAELELVSVSVQHGQHIADALAELVARWPRPEVRIVGAALALASENETGSARALDGVSQTLRDRAAIANEVRTHSAQATASLYALVALPVGFLCIDAVGSKQATTYLTTSSFGWFCLVIGVVCDLVGWLWMTALVRRRLPA